MDLEIPGTARGTAWRVPPKITGSATAPLKRGAKCVAPVSIWGAFGGVEIFKAPLSLDNQIMHADFRNVIVNNLFFPFQVLIQ